MKKVRSVKVKSVKVTFGTNPSASGDKVKVTVTVEREGRDDRSLQVQLRYFFDRQKLDFDDKPHIKLIAKDKSDVKFETDNVTNRTKEEQKLGVQAEVDTEFGISDVKISAAKSVSASRRSPDSIHNPISIVADPAGIGIYDGEPFACKLTVGEPQVFTTSPPSIVYIEYYGSVEVDNITGPNPVQLSVGYETYFNATVYLKSGFTQGSLYLRAISDDYTIWVYSSSSSLLTRP